MNKAIELNPEKAIYYNFRGEIKSKLNDKSGAINDLNKEISLDDSTEILNDKVAILESYQEYEEGLKTTNILLSEKYKDNSYVKENYKKFLQFKGQFLLILNRESEAKEIFSYLIENNYIEKKYSYKLRAYIYTQNKEYDKALEDLRKLRELSPNEGVNDQIIFVYFKMLGNVNEKTSIKENIDIINKIINETDFIIRNGSESEKIKALETKK